MPRLKNYILGLILFQLFSFYNLQGQYLVEEFRPKIKSSPMTASHIIQDDGKIVLLGDYTFIGDSAVVNLLRFHADGQLDTEFILDSELSQEFTTDFRQCCGRARVFLGVDTDLILMADGFRRRVSIIDGSGQLKTDISTPTGYFQIERIIRHKDGYIAIIHATGTAESVFRLDKNGEVDTTFPRIDYDGYVEDMIVDSDNNVMILGNMTIDGVSRNLIRISELGLLDSSLNDISLPFPFAEIDLFPDGRILVSAYTQITLLDANANVIESFIPDTNGSQIFSSLIDPVNDRIIIFIEQYPLPNVIKALELDGSVSDSFTEIAINNFSNSLSRVLRHNDTFILATDHTIEYKNTTQSFLVFDADGKVSSDISTREKIFNVGKVNTAVSLEDGSIIIGGDFDYIGNTPVNNLVKLDRLGNVDQTFNANNPLSTNDEVKKIEISPDNGLYIGGFFHDILSVSENSLVRINLDGELDISFVTNKTSTASDNFLNDFIIMNDRIIACGDYNQDVVAFDFNGNDVSAFNQNIFGSKLTIVKSLCKVDEDNFAISGEVLNEAGFLWIMDIDGDIDNSFVRQDNIPIDSEHIVKVGNNLYRSGQIMGGQSSSDPNFIYKYNLETGEIDESNFSTYILSVNKHLLHLNDSVLLVSGDFDQFNNNEAHNFVATNFNGQPYERLAFDVSPDIDGYDLQKNVLISGEEVLLMGKFTSINDIPFYSIALINTTNFIPEVNLIESYTISEDTSFYVSDLVEIIDLDDQYELSIENHENVLIAQDGLISLQQDYNGSIDLSFSVSDPLTMVGPFIASLEVLPVNDAPEIVDQLGLPAILPGEQYEISIDQLNVIDVDNEELTLSVDAGENYTVVGGTTILSDESFSGYLNVAVTASDGSLNSDEFLFSIESSHPLGLGDDISNLEIYPNPSTNYLKVNDVENIEHISIHNMDGQKIIDYSYNDLTNMGNTIQTSVLQQGMYIVNVLLKSNERHYFKLIKN